ncbi:MAG: permease [Saprospiraceae bacterium]|nr:permease [Saprospiraceae bacterium]MCB9318124.1 permease [Lewinellaceae bacterium]
MFDWLQKIADGITYRWLHLEPGNHLADALNFFIYDSVKILLLLTFVIFFMGIVNSYFPVEKVRNYLSRNRFYGFEYLMASLFGVVTPFCSCSSVPLFIGFVKGGIPLGVTFAFLITSPLVNEVAIGLFVGLFGLRVTAIYVVSGIILGMTSGFILSRLRLERYLTPWVQDVLDQSQKEEKHWQAKPVTLRERLPGIWADVVKILRGVLPYVVAGIAIGGLMHGYIPEGFFERYLAKGQLFAVPLATLLAVPMYSNASGVIPIVQVLVSKGIPVGTALAFMMAVVGLSIPEGMLLKKVMTIKLIGIFFGVVTLCIILSGYLFNIIL